MWMTPDTEITSHRHRAGHHRTIWLLTNCEGGERWWQGSTAGVTCEFSVEANCAVGGRRAYCGPLTSNLVNNSRSRGGGGGGGGEDGGVGGGGEGGCGRHEEIHNGIHNTIIEC